MEIVGAIVIIALIVWYFGKALNSLGTMANNVFEASARMGQTQMNIYEASHKASAIEAMADIDIDTEKVKVAQANIEALKSIDL